ncbi:MAG: type II toxin-antitoxin system RelE/ParE family toxin [Dehalococcoidia bacterium]|nr:type II toxin-antitoxin system RelE/ParE family toxin [Dehalococcoidia bacterium]
MSYEVLILRRAQRELAELPSEAYQRVKEAILNLANQPRPRGSRKLSGREGWRIRVGNYRVVYEIDDTQQTITILHVGHRRDVYRS